VQQALEYTAGYTAKWLEQELGSPRTDGSASVDLKFDGT
jgi:hypothetical protein